MKHLLTWWERPSVTTPAQTRLTLREAARFIGQSHRAVADDCKFLGIGTYPNKGGCLNRQNMFDLVAFAGWKIWKMQINPQWRGDRDDYWDDWKTEAERYAYGPSRKVFDDNFDEFLELIDKRPSQYIGGMKYAA